MRKYIGSLLILIVLGLVLPVAAKAYNLQSAAEDMDNYLIPAFPAVYGENRLPSTERPRQEGQVDRDVAAVLERAKGERAQLEARRQAAEVLRNAEAKSSKMLLGLLEAQTGLTEALMEAEPGRWETASASWQGREPLKILDEWDDALTSAIKAGTVEAVMTKSLHDALSLARREVTAFDKAAPAKPAKALLDNDRDTLFHVLQSQRSALGKLLSANYELQRQLDSRRRDLETRISDLQRLIDTLTPPPVPVAPALKRSTP